MRIGLITSGLVLASIAGTASAASQTYPGNGTTGFGGPLGNGSLTVDDTTNAGQITFTFNSGANFNSNAVVIYVDSRAGGVTNTSTLNDQTEGDGGRRAISGSNGTDRSLVTFAPTFDADRAIAVEPSFAGLFDITNTPTNFGFVDSGGITGSGTGPFVFSFTPAELGLTGNSFDFVATLISRSEFRSNETIGTSVTTPDPANIPNAGFIGTQVFADFRTFTLSPVPEPTTLAAAAGAGLLALRRRRK